MKTSLILTKNYGYYKHNSKALDKQWINASMLCKSSIELFCGCTPNQVKITISDKSFANSRQFNVDVQNGQNRWYDETRQNWRILLQPAAYFFARLNAETIHVLIQEYPVKKPSDTRTTALA